MGWKSKAWAPALVIFLNISLSLSYLHTALNISYREGSIVKRVEAHATSLDVTKFYKDPVILQTHSATHYVSRGGRQAVFSKKNPDMRKDSILLTSADNRFAIPTPRGGKKRQFILLKKSPNHVTPHPETTPYYLSFVYLRHLFENESSAEAVDIAGVPSIPEYDIWEQRSIRFYPGWQNCEFTSLFSCTSIKAMIIDAIDRMDKNDRRKRDIKWEDEDETYKQYHFVAKRDTNSAAKDPKDLTPIKSAPGFDPEDYNDLYLDFDFHRPSALKVERENLGELLDSRRKRKKRNVRKRVKREEDSNEELTKAKAKLKGKLFEQAFGDEAKLSKYSSYSQSYSSYSSSYSTSSDGGTTTTYSNYSNSSSSTTRIQGRGFKLEVEGAAKLNANLQMNMALKNVGVGAMVSLMGLAEVIDSMSGAADSILTTGEQSRSTWDTIGSTLVDTAASGLVRLGIPQDWSKLAALGTQLSFNSPALISKPFKLGWRMGVDTAGTFLNGGIFRGKGFDEPDSIPSNANCIFGVLYAGCDNGKRFFFPAGIYIKVYILYGTIKIWGYFKPGSTGHPDTFYPDDENAARPYIDQKGILIPKGYNPPQDSGAGIIGTTRRGWSFQTDTEKMTVMYDPNEPQWIGKIWVPPFTNDKRVKKRRPLFTDDGRKILYGYLFLGMEESPHIFLAEGDSVSGFFVPFDEQHTEIEDTPHGVFTPTHPAGHATFVADSSKDVANIKEVRGVFVPDAIELAGGISGKISKLDDSPTKFSLVLDQPAVEYTYIPESKDITNIWCPYLSPEEWKYVPSTINPDTPSRPTRNRNSKPGLGARKQPDDDDDEVIQKPKEKPQVFGIKVVTKKTTAFLPQNFLIVGYVISLSTTVIYTSFRVETTLIKPDLPLQFKITKTWKDPELGPEQVEPSTAKAPIPCLFRPLQFPIDDGILGNFTPEPDNSGKFTITQPMMNHFFSPDQDMWTPLGFLDKLAVEDKNDPTAPQKTEEVVRIRSNSVEPTPKELVVPGTNKKRAPVPRPSENYKFGPKFTEKDPDLNPNNEFRETGKPGPIGVPRAAPKTAEEPKPAMTNGTNGKSKTDEQPESGAPAPPAPKPAAAPKTEVVPNGNPGLDAASQPGYYVNDNQPNPEPGNPKENKQPWRLVSGKPPGDGIAGTMPNNPNVNWIVPPDNKVAASDPSKTRLKITYYVSGTNGTEPLPNEPLNNEVPHEYIHGFYIKSPESPSPIFVPDTGAHGVFIPVDKSIKPRTGVYFPKKPTVPSTFIFEDKTKAIIPAGTLGRFYVFTINRQPSRGFFYGKFEPNKLEPGGGEPEILPGWEQPSHSKITPDALPPASKNDVPPNHFIETMGPGKYAIVEVGGGYKGIVVDSPESAFDDPNNPIFQEYLHYRARKEGDVNPWGHVRIVDLLTRSESSENAPTNSETKVVKKAQFVSSVDQQSSMSSEFMSEFKSTSGYTTSQTYTNSLRLGTITNCASMMDYRLFMMNKYTLKKVRIGNQIMRIFIPKSAEQYVTVSSKASFNKEEEMKFLSNIKQKQSENGGSGNGNTDSDTETVIVEGDGQHFATKYAIKEEETARYDEYVSTTTYRTGTVTNKTTVTTTKTSTTTTQEISWSQRKTRSIKTPKTWDDDQSVDEIKLDEYQAAQVIALMRYAKSPDRATGMDMGNELVSGEGDIKKFSSVAKELLNVYEKIKKEQGKKEDEKLSGLTSTDLLGSTSGAIERAAIIEERRRSRKKRHLIRKRSADTTQHASILPGWKTQHRTLTKNATLSANGMIFYGLGNCEQLQSPDMSRWTRDPEKLIGYYLKVMRIDCMENAKERIINLVNEGFLKFDKSDKFFEIPAELKLTMQKRLTPIELKKLSVAFEFHAFTKTYCVIRDNGYLPKGVITQPFTTITRSTAFLTELSFYVIQKSRIIVPMHGIRMIRNMLATLRTVLTKLHQDSIALRLCPTCDFDKELTDGDKFRIVSLIQFIIHGLGPFESQKQQLKPSFNEFVELNVDAIKERVKEFEQLYPKVR